MGGPQIPADRPTSLVQRVHSPLTATVPAGFRRRRLVQVIPLDASRVHGCIGENEAKCEKNRPSAERLLHQNEPPDCERTLRDPRLGARFDRALEFPARDQRDDGSWSFSRSAGRKAGWRTRRYSRASLYRPSSFTMAQWGASTSTARAPSSAEPIWQST